MNKITVLEYIQSLAKSIILFFIFISTFDFLIDSSGDGISAIVYFSAGLVWLIITVYFNGRSSK